MSSRRDSGDPGGYDACGIENVELSGGLDYADDMEDSIEVFSSQLYHS